MTVEGKLISTAYLSLAARITFRIVLLVYSDSFEVTVVSTHNTLLVPAILVSFKPDIAFASRTAIPSEHYNFTPARVYTLYPTMNS